MTINYEDVYSKVKKALVEALGREESDIVPAAKLAKDLDAESIDYLDIAFRLEQAFGITIPRGELFPEGLLSDPEYSDGVSVTPKGVAELKKRMPFADLSEFEQDPKLNRLQDVFTVQMIVNYVITKIKEKQAAA